MKFIVQRPLTIFFSFAHFICKRLDVFLGDGIQLLVLKVRFEVECSILLGNLIEVKVTFFETVVLFHLDLLGLESNNKISLSKFSLVGLLEVIEEVVLFEFHESAVPHLVESFPLSLIKDSGVNLLVCEG